MWNWQEIKTEGSDKLNLPKFDVPVLLYMEKDGKKYAIVGYLKSIDAKGAHWSNNSTNIFDLFDGIFNGLGSKVGEKGNEEFIPTHWCSIIVPGRNDNNSYFEEDLHEAFTAGLNRGIFIASVIQKQPIDGEYLTYEEYVEKKKSKNK